MFRQRYIFGVLLAAVAAVGISACNNGGSSNNNSGNPCGNPYYYNNPGYNNGYNNGGCAGANGNRPLIVGANNNNVASQQNAAQAVQQAQLREAIAEADATRLNEDNQRLKKRHRSDDSDDDDSSGSSGPSVDTVTVSAGPTVRVVPVSGSTIVIPAASTSTTTPAASTPPAQTPPPPPPSPSLATLPANQGPQINQTVIPSAGNTGSQTYQGNGTLPTGGSTINNNQPAASAGTVTTTPAGSTAASGDSSSGPVSTPTDSQSTTAPTTATSSGGTISGGTAAPAAPAQQQPVGSSLGPAQPQVLQVSVIHQDILPSSINADGLAAYNLIRSQVNMANALPVEPLSPYEYETRLSQSTPLQLPSQKIGKKTYTYYIEHTPYIPNDLDFSNPDMGDVAAGQPPATGLWGPAFVHGDCDIETQNPNAGACIVLERDLRSDSVVDRAYAIGGRRRDKSQPKSATNYELVRAELPDSVAPAVHTLLSKTAQGLLLITPLPTQH